MSGPQTTNTTTNTPAAAAAAAKKPLRIGVMFEKVQLSDIVGIDIFGNLSTEYFDEVVHMLPSLAPLRPLALPMEFVYLSTSATEPTTMTPSLRALPTSDYDSCDPASLDVLLVGGPTFSHRPEAAARFRRRAWECTPVVMTTCVGSLWLADALKGCGGGGGGEGREGNLMKGARATTNRGALGVAMELHPDVEWVDQRWVVDAKPCSSGEKGELWTSGGAGCGIEMIAHYCLGKYDPMYVRALALTGLDFDPEGSRGQFYSEPRQK